MAVWGSAGKLRLGVSVFGALRFGMAGVAKWVVVS